jgi:protein SCO1/2
VSTRSLYAALTGATLLLAACGKNSEDAAFEMLQPPAAPAVLAKHWKLPEFALTERSGATLGLADLAGKVWVADFFYTTCPGPCPMLSSRLSDVQKALGNESGVRLVSISVDPEKDTPEVLKKYAEAFKANERWLFFTGQKDAIYSLAREGFKLPIADAPAEGGLIIHTTRLILVDKEGVVRGFYEGGNETGVVDLIRDMRRLLEEA